MVQLTQARDDGLPRQVVEPTSPRVAPSLLRNAEALHVAVQRLTLRHANDNGLPYGPDAPSGFKRLRGSILMLLSRVIPSLCCRS